MRSPNHMHYFGDRSEGVGGMSDHQKMAEDLSKECRKLVGQIIIKHDHAIIEQLHSEVGAYKAKIATLEEWFEDLKAQLKEREWISVEDRLPEEKPFRFESVMVHKSNGVIFEAMFNTKIREFMTGRFTALSCPVTHWMPLPSPPKEQG